MSPTPNISEILTEKMIATEKLISETLSQPRQFISPIGYTLIPTSDSASFGFM
jgi:hypothetical protein